MLWSWSVEGLIQTFSSRFCACSRSQTPSYSSPPTKRKLSCPSRKTVASSIIPRVACNHPLHEALGVGPEDLPLAERRQVHERRVLPAGPVLRDAVLVREAVRQPIPAVLDEALRQLARPRMEGGLLGQHSLRIGGHAMRDRLRERVLLRIDTDVHVRD